MHNVDKSVHLSVNYLVGLPGWRVSVFGSVFFVISSLRIISHLEMIVMSAM